MAIKRFLITANTQLKPPSKTNLSLVAAKIRAGLNDLDIKVGVKIDSKTASNMRAVSSAAKDVSKNTEQAASAMQLFGEQSAFAIKRFGAFVLATSGFRLLLGSLRDGINDAIDYQREFIKISQVTGQTVSSLQSLSSEIRNLSTGLGAQSSELLQASRILSQTGLSADEVKISLDALAKSDLAPTFDNIIKTTEGSIAIFRQFGVEAENLESVLGSINAVSGKFAIESDDIITAVRRTGGAFVSAGGNLNEFIGLLTSVRATTRESAESIATGFRTIFTRLQRVRTLDFLKEIGIDLTDNGQFADT